jgi:Tfp pilus assembly protein PilO
MIARLHRKKHKIDEAPAWQRKVVLIVSVLAAATFLLFAAWAVVLLIERARIDDCLDDGGSYDYERGRCDFVQNHPG